MSNPIGANPNCPCGPLGHATIAEHRARGHKDDGSPDWRPTCPADVHPEPDQSERYRKPEPEPHARIMEHSPDGM